MQPANTQPQSPLGRLPREIRDLIYLELLRISGGHRQHIVWHGTKAEGHFCRWPCSMPSWEPEDGLQQRITMLKEQGLPVSTQDTRRLQSPWMNHWACGEEAWAKADADVGGGKLSTAFGRCWWEEAAVSREVDLPMRHCMAMLLVCKQISAECLESVYRATTFIFTDLMSYQLLVGFCKMPPQWEKAPTRPSPTFLKQARKLEISLWANFNRNVPCTDADHMAPDPAHDALDFHWLRLDRFESLKYLKIWVLSREGYHFFDSTLPPPARLPSLRHLDSDALKTALQAFKEVESVALSAALHEDVKTTDGDEDGFVDGVAGKNVRLWKRGTGDRYHPHIGFGIEPDGRFDGLLMNYPERRVEEMQYFRTVEHVHPVRMDPAVLEDIFANIDRAEAKRRASFWSCCLRR